MTSSDIPASNSRRTPFYFSVDFEDMGADLLRALSVDGSAAVRRDALYRSYEEIQQFAKTSLGGRPLTFFCTGTLGEQTPDLIGQIARDGHEIACHYHFHDPVFGDSPELVDRRAKQAIDALESASNSKVYGFRAPMFSITADNREHYQMLARNFAYDSSLIANVDRGFDETAFAELTDGGAMRLFPVPMMHKAKFIRHKAGGTFFKLFPIEWTLDVINLAWTKGLAPVFYIHPYEFAVDGRYRLSLDQLKSLGVAKQAYWWLRQSQWHSINQGVLEKLESLCARIEHQGVMRDLLAR